MSDPADRTLVPAYSTITEGELLALTLNPDALTETARRALDAELARRHISQETLAAYRAQAAKTRARQERWRKVRRLRFRDNFFHGILWPLGVLCALAALLIGAGFLQDGLTRANVSRGFIPVAQLCAAVLFALAGVYLIYSGRADGWVHWWKRGTSRSPSDRSSRMKLFHAEFCAARSMGSGGFFLGFSLLMLFFAFRDLAMPMPAGRESTLVLLGNAYCLVLFIYAFLAMTCLRDRLVLGAWTLENILTVVREARPAILAPYAHSVRELTLILWIGAALVSLSLFRSALHAPPPGAPHVDG